MSFKFSDRLIDPYCAQKLSSTVTQFMYLEVQDHPVWSSSVFWENAFFDDIQDEIQHLYRDSLQSEKLAARLKVRLENHRSAADEMLKLKSIIQSF